MRSGSLRGALHRRRARGGSRFIQMVKTTANHYQPVEQAANRNLAKVRPRDVVQDDGRQLPGADQRQREAFPAIAQILCLTWPGGSSTGIGVPQHPSLTDPCGEKPDDHGKEDSTKQENRIRSRFEER